MNHISIFIISCFILLQLCSLNKGGGSNNQIDGNRIYLPHAPLVMCSFLPIEFVECEEPTDHKGNKTAKDANGGIGCVKFGGLKYDDVEKAKVSCSVLPGIECSGARQFQLTVPCIKYRGHYFVTTLLYSILLGFLGMDRFGLAQTGTAVGKLLTLGGVGVWWLVDIVLLVSGSLLPEDSSNWNPYV